MISIRCQPHDRLEFHDAELGDLDALRQLPWAVARVATIRPTRLGVELRIGPYVGRLIVPGKAVIDIEEPYAGSVTTCIELATSGRRAANQLSAPGRVQVSPWSAVAQAFEEALSHYVSAGIERSYVPEVFVTALPRGRIDISRTTRQLRSRGRNHQLVCHRRLLTDDTSLNRTVIAAAVRAEQLLLRDGKSRSLIGVRRSMAALGGVRRDLAPDLNQARAHVGAGRTGHHRLLSLAELLIRGVPAMPSSDRQDVTQPMTAWLNAERIFEEAVRSVVRRELGTEGGVRAGLGDGTEIFSSLTGDPACLRKAADPDVVIGYKKWTWLLDAKYRRHIRDFTEDELYQLIAHAGAYRAAVAGLVAPVRPGQLPGHQWLGRDKSGTVYYLVTVDVSTPRGLAEPIAQFLQELKQRGSAPA